MQGKLFDDMLLCGTLIIPTICSMWMHSVCVVFCYNHAGTGLNPELRTLFYWLVTVLSMPIHAFFVFDGSVWPSVKHGIHIHKKKHWLTQLFQDLLDAFGFSWCEVSLHLCLRPLGFLLWFTPILLFLRTYLFFSCDYSSLPCHRPANLTCLCNCFLPSASLDFYDSFLLTVYTSLWFHRIPPCSFCFVITLDFPESQVYKLWTCYVLP